MPAEGGKFSNIPPELVLSIPPLTSSSVLLETHINNYIVKTITVRTNAVIPTSSMNSMYCSGRYKFRAI